MAYIYNNTVIFGSVSWGWAVV